MSFLAASCLAAAGCGAATTKATTPASTATTVATGASGGPTTAPYRWQVDAAAALQVGGGPASTLAAVLAPAVTGGPATAVSAATWLIAGTQTQADGSTAATVWTSPDALTWTASALTGPGVDSQARAATRWGNRTVVVGSIGTGTGQRAATWLSPGPGLPFQQIAGGDAFAPPAASGPAGGAEMDVVAAGGLGVFAAGTVAGTQAIWYSTDGRHWTRLKQAEQVIDSTPRARVTAMAVGADGVFAAGSVGDGAATDAAVWASTDGITWSSEPAPTSFTGNGDHSISSLVSLGTGFVAAGAVRTGQISSPASWISPNGRSWSQASLAFPMPAGPRPDATGAAVDGMTTTTTAPSAATTATGTLDAVGGSSTEQRLWTSTDGTAWSAVALPPTATDAADWRAARVATDGSTTIVVDDTVGVPRVLVDRPQGWTEVTATPAAFGAPRVAATPARLLTTGSAIVLVARLDDPGQALGTESTSAAAFTSPDGVTWTPAGSSPFVGHDVADVAAVTGGLVAVGGASALSSTLTAGPPGAAAWTSPDGRTWTPAAAGAAFGGGAAGPARATAVTRLGQTVVAVGDAAAVPSGPADQAVAWTSSDGHTWSAPAALDSTPTLASEATDGVCAGPQTAAAVGSTVGAGPGAQAAAWSSSDGTHWQPATVTPTPDPAANEAMQSCITAGNGFIGFGASQGPQGTVDPAIWYSNTGSTWSRQTVPAFTGSGLGPVKDLAVAGTTWLAVSGGGGQTTLPGGGLGVWRSTDAGSNWQRLDTSGAPWVAQQASSVDRVLLSGQDALVAGAVDGRLTLWVGTPTSPSSGGSSTTTSSTSVPPSTEPPTRP